MITINDLCEIKAKSENNIATYKEEMWKLENKVEFEKAKIAVCDEMIEMENAKEQCSEEAPIENCEETVAESVDGIC